MWNRKRTVGLLSGLALALLALAGGVVYFVSSPDFERLAAGYLLRSIEEQTGARATLDAFNADLGRLHFSVNGLVLRGTEDEAGPPLASVERIEADLSWRGLLRRSLDLTRLSVTRPEIFITFSEDGSSNVPMLPASRPESSPALGVTIADLDVSGGSLVIDEERVDIDFAVTGLEAEFSYAAASAVFSGHLEYGGSFARMGEGFPYSLSADFDYTQGTVLVQTLGLQSGETRVQMQGRVDRVFSERDGQLAYVATLDLDSLDPVVLDGEFFGVLNVTGDLEFSPGRFSTSARVQSPAVGFEDWSAENLLANVEYAFPERTFAARGVEAEILGGRVAADLDISTEPLTRPRIEVDLEYDGIDTALLRNLYPWGSRYVVTSRSSGTVSGWFEGRFEQFDLEGQSRFEPTASTGAEGGVVVLPIQGATAYRARPGSVEIQELSVKFSSTGVTADGVFDPEAFALRFAVESQDFKDLSFLSNLANGMGRVRGVLRGSSTAPEVDLDLAVTGYSYERWAIDRFEGSARATADGVELNDVQVIRGDSELRLTGFADYALSEPDLDIEVVRLASSDVADIVSQPIDGEVTGRLHLDSIDPLSFNGGLESEELSYEGRVLGSVRALISISPEAWRASDVVVRRSGASLTGDFLFEPDTEVIAGSLALAGYRVEDLEWVGVPEWITGRMSDASIEVDGTTDAPHVEGRVLFEDLTVGGQPFPEVRLGVETESGRMSVGIDGGSDLAVEAEINTSRASGYAFQGSGRFTDFVVVPPMGGLAGESVRTTGRASFQGRLLDLDTFQGLGEIMALTVRVAGRTLNVNKPFTVRLDSERVELSNVELTGSGTSVVIGGTLGVSSEAARAGYPFQGMMRFADFAPGELVGLGPEALVLTGGVSFDGRLGNLQSLRGIGQVDRLDLLVGDRMLRVSEPFDVDFTAERIRVSRMRISGEVTSLTVEGSLGISGEVPLDLSVAGAVDLSLLAGTYAGLDTQGTVVVNGRIGGNVADPQLAGVATLQDVSLAHPGSFLSLSSLSGAVFFEGNRANLTDITGSAGGGNVALRGNVSVVGGRPTDFDIRLDAANVRVRTAQGIRTVFNGALVLQGSPDAPSLEGSVQIVDFSFSGDFNEFLALFGGGELQEVEAEGPLDQVALALHVEGDRNIRIENELASVQARVDVDIGGTMGDPTMTGHIETTSGNLNVQGTRYRITRGNVDFVDPLGIDPLIDVQAEADLRDYRIILIIAGRGDNIRLDMRSDPPLSQLEIVTLMAGGRTREELAESGSNGGLVPTNEQLFTGGAASILGDLLQERVGSRLGVLGRVRVDPFLVGAENDPGARVTVSEQITRDLAITYSQDLSSNSQQIILIEYFLNNDTSFIASRDETGALGVDVRLRKRFR